MSDIRRFKIKKRGKLLQCQRKGQVEDEPKAGKEVQEQFIVVSAGPWFLGIKQKKLRVELH